MYLKLSLAIILNQKKPIKQAMQHKFKFLLFYNCLPVMLHFYQI